MVQSDNATEPEDHREALASVRCEVERQVRHRGGGAGCRRGGSRAPGSLCRTWRAGAAVHEVARDEAQPPGHGAPVGHALTARPWGPGPGHHDASGPRRWRLWPSRRHRGRCGTVGARSAQPPVPRATGSTASAAGKYKPPPARHADVAPRRRSPLSHPPRGHLENVFLKNSGAAVVAQLAAALRRAYPTCAGAARSTLHGSPLYVMRKQQAATPVF